MDKLKPEQVQKARELVKENPNDINVDMLKLNMHIGTVTANRILEALENDEYEEYEIEKNDCKDTNCIHNASGQCTRINDDGIYGVCWMDPSEGKY